MNEQKMTEKETVKAAAAGSRDAFCELYDSYRPRLYRYAFYRLEDQADAEDAVSACVLSAWEQIGRLRSPEAFCTWIFRILSASCNSVIKERVRRREELPEDALEYEPSETADDQDPGMRLMLMEALNKLPEDSREMVLLSVIGGLKSSEIGEIFGMPQGTVRSRLSRSLAAMREELEVGNE